MSHSTHHPRQRVAILGSTGSIGVSTLDVIARHPDRFEVTALSAFRRTDELAKRASALDVVAAFARRYAKGAFDGRHGLVWRRLIRAYRIH